MIVPCGDQVQQEPRVSRGRTSAKRLRPALPEVRLAGFSMDQQASRQASHLLRLILAVVPLHKPGEVPIGPLRAIHLGQVGIERLIAKQVAGGVEFNQGIVVGVELGSRRERSDFVGI